jgi:multidrug efflux system membrane fusion protein
MSILQKNFKFKQSPFLIFFTLFLLNCSCNKKPPAQPSLPPLVEAGEVDRADVPFYVYGIGQLVPFRQVTISPQVDGIITGIYFKDGDLVEEGQLLYTIDPRPYEAAMLQAVGSLALDQANLVLSKKLVERYYDLYKNDFYSAANYDTLVQNMKSNEGAVERDQGAIAAAKLNIEYSRITAPFKGIIGIHQVDPGNIAVGRSGQSLVTLVQSSPIYAQFTISESSLGDIRHYQNIHPLSVYLYFQNASDPSLEGTLFAIDNTVEVNTGMITMRAIIPNEDYKGWAGQYIKAQILVKYLKDSLIVTETAIQSGPDGKFVYVIKPDMTVEKRTVQKGLEFDQNVVIEKGLEEGEKVVTDGQLNIYPGAKVAIKPPSITAKANR